MLVGCDTDHTTRVIRFTYDVSEFVLWPSRLAMCCPCRKLKLGRSVVRFACCALLRTGMCGLERSRMLDQRPTILLVPAHGNLTCASVRQ